MEEPFEIYSFFNSSTAFRLRIALELKRLKWRQHTVNLRTGEHHAAAFEQVNPAHQVPVLIHGGNKITQSLAIIDYLDQVEPQPRLLPTSGPLRTRVLEVASVVACDMHQVNNMRTQKFLSDSLSVSAEQRASWVSHWWSTGFSALEYLLAPVNEGWCLGDGPTLADCCVVPQVANALRGGFNFEPFPSVWRSYEFCMRHAAFQKAAPSAQPDFVAH